jgi:hypothetical protein
MNEMAAIRTRNRLLQSESLDTALTNATWDNFTMNEASPLADLDSPIINGNINGNTSVETMDASFVTSRLWVAGSVGVVVLLIVLTLCRRLVSERALINDDAMAATPKKDAEDTDVEQGKVLKRVLSNESTVVLSPTISNDEDDDMTASETSHNSNNSTGASSRRTTAPNNASLSTSTPDGAVTMVTSWPPSSRDPNAPPPHRLYRMDSFVKALQQDRQQRLQEENERRQRQNASVLLDDDTDLESASHIVTEISNAAFAKAANVQ